MKTPTQMLDKVNNDWKKIAKGAKQRLKTAIVDVVYEGGAVGGAHIHVELDP